MVLEGGEINYWLSLGRGIRSCCLCFEYHLLILIET